MTAPRLERTALRPATAGDDRPWARGPLGILLGFVGLAALLAGCTGTTEPSVPTLLAVGYQDGSTPHVALVLDSNQTGDARFAFLADSVRILPATPVAFDIVNRAGVRNDIADRSELVVLSREQDEPYNSFLSYFRFSDIDPANPARFQLSRTPQVQLDSLTGAPEDFCPVAVQVSSNGNRVALVSDPSACGGFGTIELYVLDLGAKTLSPATDGTFDTPAAYVDQDTDRLYFVEAALGSADILWLPMSDINQPAKDVAEVDIGGAEVRDLGPVQDSLALLTDTEVAYVTSYKTAPKVADVSPNISGGRQLILDDYLFSPNVMVRNEDTFWILGGLEDEQADSRPVSSAGAALDPDKQFVYFVQDQGIGIFDLLLYPKDSPPVIECGDSSFCTIPELTKPAFITWTRAAPAAMP